MRSDVPDQRDTRHYLGMDLLRGVAAVIVVGYHLSFRLGLPDLFAHGYLTVDFFFGLSGFVVAKAYEGRIASGRMSLKGFALLRAVRLMPLIVFGTVLAALMEVGRPGVADQHGHVADTSRALAMGVVLLPTLWATGLEQAVFPLNGPSWSLFFEAVANGVFGGWARSRLGPWSLWPFLLFGLATMSWGLAKHVHVTYGALPSTFWLGFGRVSWSFAAGIVTYHLRRHAPRVPIVVPLVALVGVAMVPTLGAADDWFDTACILVVLPCVVFASTTSDLGERVGRLATLAGALSYPVYAIHYPLVRMFGILGMGLHASVPGRTAFAIAAVASVLMASAIVRSCYDEPVRRWLTRRLAGPRQGTGGPEIAVTAEMPSLGRS